VGLGFLGGKLFGALFRRWKAGMRFWKRGQVAAAALMAFAHGLQDTPKFASVLLLANGGEQLAWGTMLFCSGVISLGTLLGGGRIVQTVGGQMVKMDPKEGFAADLSGAISLFLSTWQGLPVSTTHAKTCAMMGAAGQLDRRIAASMFAAWALTFPICGVLAFLLTKLFLLFPF
jgi:PiT family inorganic phosphate transporter